MSAFSTIYDAIDTLVSTTLTDYVKAPKNIIVEENPNLLMKKGYVISWGDALNTQRFTSCKLSISRVFTISLINRVVSNETKADQVEAEQKAMFANQLDLIRAIENDVTLSDSCTKALFLSDGGIQYLAGDRINYYLLQSEIEVEYIENL